jgi:hypothetical protein
MEKKLLGGNFTFQQDAAPAHTDRHTQQWCEEHFSDFWSKTRWPPTSPDLNPLNYSIWYELCTQIDWTKITNKNTLIEQILKGTKKVNLNVVRSSIECWTNRVYRLLLNNGEYIL